MSPEPLHAALAIREAAKGFGRQRLSGDSYSYFRTASGPSYVYRVPIGENALSFGTDGKHRPLPGWVFERLDYSEW